jgi:hypothetical protein
MGTPGVFHREKLVVGILLGRAGSKDEILAELAASFGPPDFRSDPIPFTFTDYYEEELGAGITRLFVSFWDLVDPDSLAGIKLATNEMEDRTGDGGKRRVNLDPGLLCLSRFVLATTKESSHRIPLRSGIYAELTLLYEKGTFRPVEWTYPDYGSGPYIAILNGIRDLYKGQIRPKRRAP